MKKTLTIFTPTYNRAHTLSRCYESMLRQTSEDFKWLIIDDGSTDQTGELVRSWQEKEQALEILYIFKENGGIHTAFNTAYQMIDTELNMCLGSDDYLTDDAVETILDQWRKNKSIKYAGIIALNRYQNGEIVGKELPLVQDIHLMEYYRKGGRGDKKLIYRTEIVQSFPEYPVFEEERFLSVGYKFLLIDQQYSLLVLNQPICNVEYSPDGYTKNMNRIRVENPKGFSFVKGIELKYEYRFFHRIKLTLLYTAYSLMAGNRDYLMSTPNKFLTVLLLPLSLAVMVLLRIKAGHSVS